MFERNRALHGDLPEVPIQRQNDTGLGFGEIQEVDIRRSWQIGPGPEDIVAAGAERLDQELRDVPVS